MEVTRKPFKAVELDMLRVEEDFFINVTVSSGEVFSGQVTSIDAKKISIHIADEIGDRLFGYNEIENVTIMPTTTQG